MPQFLIDPKKLEGSQTILGGAEAKHLTRVLRYQVGDRIWVSDGEHRWRAVIEKTSGREVALKLLEKMPLKKTAPSPVLGLALLKHDHLEEVLQKGVELGVGEFFLIQTERTIPHFDRSAAAKKMERFQKIASEAAKQSGMVGVTQIHPPILFEDLVKEFRNFSAVILAWEEENVTSFHSVFSGVDPSRLLILIGPEGGWTAAEVSKAEAAGAKTASLGQQILRSETAAVVTLTLCQYELGNL